MKTMITQNNRKKTTVKTVLNFVRIGTLAFALTLFANHAHSQNLEFSQIILVTNSQQAVPAGKVWQVVSYWQSNVPGGYNHNFSTSCSNNFRPFKINGKDYYKYNGAFGYVNSYSYTYALSNDFPLWLPTGTTLETRCTDDILSVIEYTVH